MTTGSGAPPLRILALAGSLRQASLNRRLLQAAALLTPAGLDIRLDDSLRSLPLFDEDLEEATSGGPPSVTSFRARVAAADGLLIATPEYNWSLPGVLKNALDWLSRGSDEVLTGKPVAIIGVSSGPWGTRLAQAALRQVLTATESQVLPSPALFLRDGGALFDDAGRLIDAPTRDQLRAVLEAFAGWAAANKRLAPEALHAGV